MGRYDNTKKIRYLDHEVLAKWGKYPWLIEKPSDDNINIFRVVTQNAGEPRRIASAVYGDHNLYWVITAFNSRWYQDAGATNVFDWPVAGQIIYYPSFSIISPSIT